MERNTAKPTKEDLLRNPEIAGLMVQFADVYRRIRIAKYADMNIDVVVAFACDDMLNEMANRPGGNAYRAEVLRDDVAYLEESLA